jgi:peptide-methionine (R)-S-oxide reductase
MGEITRRTFFLTAAGVGGVLATPSLSRRLLSLGATPAPTPGNPPARSDGKVKIVEFDDNGKRLGEQIVPLVVKSDAEWKQLLPAASYTVTRHGDTEMPYSGQYDNFYKPGIYRCICCDNALFSSQTKFESGTGWPSFWAPIAKENVTEIRDLSLGMERIAVSCTECDAHLGHVFDDGPRPTGLRYCMNSASLKLMPKK